MIFMYHHAYIDVIYLYILLIVRIFLSGRLMVIMLGLLTLAMGILLSSIPWIDYIILKVNKTI